MPDSFDIDQAFMGIHSGRRLSRLSGNGRAKGRKPALWSVSSRLLCHEPAIDGNFDPGNVRRVVAGKE